MKYDVIVVGVGFAGAVIARECAEKNQRVLVIDQRNHIGGNMYDFIDQNKVRVHQYGPHIFHTNSQHVVDYLSKFTEWYPYEHRVLAYVEGQLVPVPFNLRSIELVFDEKKATRIKEKLILEYGLEQKVSILKLRENKDEDIKELADFVFEHVFKHYTMKQWGLSVEEISAEVTNRVPVHISYDDRYFQDQYQQLPQNGYAAIFESMLKHSNIELRLNTQAKEILRLDWTHHDVYFESEVFTGKLIYTGPIDELADYRFGALPYRSLEFENLSFETTQQSVGTVNYPTPYSKHPYTRITEFKHLMETMPTQSTCYAEYPYAYDPNGEKGNIPYYPVFTDENQSLYKKYVEAFKAFETISFVGRLAEYKYYNMDAIVLRALQFSKQI